jgi:hypothetical protein
LPDASLKAFRNRIASVKATRKTTGDAKWLLRLN